MENNSNLKTMADLVIEHRERALAFVRELDARATREGSEWNNDTYKLAKAFVEFSRRELSLSSPIVPEVVEWHYKRMVGPHSVYELDDLGKRGWELCSSYWENNFLYQIFKRKKQNK